MIKSNWLIKVYYDDNKTKLLFEKEYKNVKEITQDFKGLTRNFLYDFGRWQKNGVCTENSRKKKCLEKYKRLIIIKTRVLKDNTIKTETFKL